VRLENFDPMPVAEFRRRYIEPIADRYKWTKEWQGYQDPDITYLAYYGWIEYDPSTGMVSPGPRLRGEPWQLKIPSWARRGLLIQYSFGIEYEGNWRGRGCPPNRYAVGNGWGRQADPTAGFEISTPPYTDLENAWKSHYEQWRYWTDVNQGYIPVFHCNRYRPSIGGHIHIGLPSKRMNNRERKCVVEKVWAYLPYLYFINASDYNGTILSRRMVERPYSAWINNVSTVGEERREVSFSGHGTVEFRMFDANVPAVQLSCAYLLQQVAAKGVPMSETKKNDVHNLSREVLSLRLSAILRAREVWDTVPDIRLPSYQSMREVLTLSFAFLLNPAHFVQTRRQPNEFWLKAVREGTFLEGARLSARKKEIAQKVRQVAQDAQTIGDLLEKIYITEYVLALARTQNIDLGPDAVYIDDKVERNVSWVQMTSGPREFVRLISLTPAQIEALQNITQRSWEEMIGARERWYVLPAGDDIRAAVAVLWSERIVVWEWARDSRAAAALERFLRKNGCRRMERCAESQESG